MSNNFRRAADYVYENRHLEGTGQLNGVGELMAKSINRNIALMKVYAHSPQTPSIEELENLLRKDFNVMANPMAYADVEKLIVTYQEVKKAAESYLKTPTHPRLIRFARLEIHAHGVANRVIEPDRTGRKLREFEAAIKARREAEK
ncbi:hypothetical protein [Paraburkholderia bryophila]|uniref:Uncharacterized protein n=1 Tax=Paraburkholderia bryophila TaxID=420952 RepID=A0A7Y9W3D6_9BURK|nr:hypothetical protein [Paraburkholderia bryophila]NYH13540.1 hypothetical protein [Paraburkholderia bryophila]